MSSIRVVGYGGESLRISWEVEGVIFVLFILSEEEDLVYENNGLRYIT